MIIQNIVLPRTGICTEELMYFRRNNKCHYFWCDEQISFQNGGSISFDTYFNAVSLEKWKKYTRMDNLRLKLKLKGTFLVTLMYKELIEGTINTKYIYEMKISSETMEYMSFDFNSILSTGIACFSITSLEDNGCLLGGYYETDSSQEAIDNVHLGLVICTYRREEFVYNSIQTLLHSFPQNEDTSVIFDVFIIDNAKSINPEKIEGENIHLVTNKNTGGSGGFTRGLIEINKYKTDMGITHALLMDDDIVFDSESIYRTVSILSILKDEYRDSFLGGAMFRMDRKWFQHESGALWDGVNVVSLKYGLDMRELNHVIFNEIEENPHYNAWWYCVIPVSVIKEDNLPLPLFIKCDDVEYGLRNINHLILLNGICAWHEPFENKYTSFLYYYILKNKVICSAMRGYAFSKKRLIKDLTNEVVREIFYYRYKNAELLLRGIEDFLVGTKWFLECDGELFHKRLIEFGYKLQFVDTLDMTFDYGRYDYSLRESTDSKFHKFFRTITINGQLLSSKREVIVPTNGARPINCYRAQRVLNYDYVSRKGFITEKDLKQTKLLLLRLYKVRESIKRHYSKVILDYQTNGHLITNLSFWDEYLK